MSEPIGVYVYGAMIPSDADKIAQRERWFIYLKSVIENERLNPSPDYDDLRQIKLLKTISVSMCDCHQRRVLSKMLSIWDEQDDNNIEY